MPNEPHQPTGSQVHVERAPNRAKLTFTGPGSGSQRDLPGAGFLLLWLAVWAGAIGLLVMQILNTGGTNAIVPIIFLSIWTLLGFGAILQLKKKVVPAGPESVTLDRFTFRHHLGPRAVTGPGRVRTREVELDRTDLEVHLNQAAGRLEYQHETGHVEIGPQLSPEDKQYVLDLIHTWMADGDV